jgi:hypothetical protein
MTEKENQLSLKQANQRIYLVDSQGLVVKSRTGLNDEKLPYAHDHPAIKDLKDIVTSVKPTCLPALRRRCTRPHTERAECRRAGRLESQQLQPQLLKPPLTVGLSARGAAASPAATHRCCCCTFRSPLTSLLYQLQAVSPRSRWLCTQRCCWRSRPARDDRRENRSTQDNQLSTSEMCACCRFKPDLQSPRRPPHPPPPHDIDHYQHKERRGGQCSWSAAFAQ